jgi:hypothetical protein
MFKYPVYQPSLSGNGKNMSGIVCAAPVPKNYQKGARYES